MRVGYCRVSTAEQNTARQEVLMEKLGVDKIFIDKCSGKNTDRPALREMLSFVREKDVIICESISRLCRNVRDLLQFVDDFNRREISVIFLKENIDTSPTSPTATFILTVLAAISELERDFILQRQREGIEIAKLAGVYKGRKPLDCPDFDKVYQQVKIGKISATEAFRQLNISKSTYYRRVREKQRATCNQSSE